MNEEIDVTVCPNGEVKIKVPENAATIKEVLLTKKDMGELKRRAKLQDFRRDEQLPDDELGNG